MWRLPSKILFSIFLIAGGGAANAQDASDQIDRSCGCIFGLCGYANAEGTLVISQQFEIAQRFSDGVAAVRQDGLWGYVDAVGTFVIDPIFELAGDFNNGRAEVVFDGGAGVIDLSGDFTIPPEFWRAIPMGQDAALVLEIGEAGTTQRNLSHTHLFDEFHLYHQDLGVVTDTPIEFDWFVRPDREGPSDLIWASLDGQIFGLMTDQGTWVVEPQFNHSQSLHEDRAIVSVTRSSGERRWGAVDANGSIVIPLQHDWLSFFDNGYALVGGPGQRERRVGLMLPNGTVVNGRLYDAAERPDGVRPARVREAGVWYIFADDGSLMREEPDGTLVASCPQGLRILREGSGYAVTNSASERTLASIIDSVAFGIAVGGRVSGGSRYRRELDCSSPVAIGRGEIGESEWTYVRTDGSLLIEQTWFTSSYRFFDGHAVVGTGMRSSDEGAQLWGILSESGEFSLPLGPARIDRRPDGRLLDGQWAFSFAVGEDQIFIDAWGTPIAMPATMEDAARDRALQCPGGARIVGDGALFGIEGPGGEMIVPSIHRAISCYRSGVAWAPREELRQWCPIGPEGTFRDLPACIGAYYPVSISHHSPEIFSEDRFESNILWLRARLEWGLGQRTEPPQWIGDGVMSEMSFSVRPFR